MARDRAEIGELAAKIFDRLDSEFEGASVVDAMLLVEIDTGEKVTLNEGNPHEREVAPTVVMLESTEDRLTIQVGIIDYCRDVILMAGSYDDE